MSKRPWPIVIIAVFHLLAPFINIFLNAFFSGRSLSNHLNYALSVKYLTLNWPIIVIPVLCGFAIYACKRWSFFLYFLLTASLCAFSYIGYASQSRSMGLIPLLSVYAVNIIVVTYFLIPAVRNIYFDPRLRWWEQYPRFRAKFTCTFGPHGTEHQGDINNFSLGGLFVLSDDTPKDFDSLYVNFDHEDSLYQFQGRAIQHAHQKKVGFGFEFNHSPQTFREAKALCNMLNKQGQKISRNKQNSRGGLLQWVKKLLFTGKGLFPEV